MCDWNIPTNILLTVYICCYFLLEVFFVNLHSLKQILKISDLWENKNHIFTGWSSANFREAWPGYQQTQTDQNFTPKDKRFLTEIFGVPTCWQ